MKRFLLTLSVALFATTMFAQGLTFRGNVEQEQANFHPSTEKVGVATVAGLTPERGKRRVVNGKSDAGKTTTIYTKPAGAMYRHYYSDTGGTYYNTHVYYPYYKEFTYENKSQNPSATQWYFNESNMGNYEDNGYNYTHELSVGYGGYIPKLYTSSSSSDYYSMAYYDEYKAYIAGSGWFTDANDDPIDFDWMSIVDNKAGYGWGSMDNHFLMGSGTYTNTSVGGVDANGNSNYFSGTFPTYRLIQDCPAPAAPMYVDGIYLAGRTFNTSTKEPIPEGCELTMYIFDLESGDLMYTLKSTSGCFIDWGLSTSSYGDNNLGCLKFYYEESDPIFGTAEAPIIIDRATEIQVLGWDQDGLSFGLLLKDAWDCDQEEDLSEAYMQFYDPTGKSGMYLSNLYRYSDDCFDINFNAIMDGLYIYDTLYDAYNQPIDGFSKILISQDGKTCYTEGKENTAYDLGEIWVETTFPWKDGAMENYSLVDQPEWLTSVNVDDSYYYDEDYYGINFVSFTAQENTAAESRYVKTYIQGRGAVCDTPITIVQLGTDGVDGITNVEVSTASSAEGAVYNVAGQRVTDSAKGILVRDGKKFIAK